MVMLQTEVIEAEESEMIRDKIDKIINREKKKIRGARVWYQG